MLHQPTSHEKAAGSNPCGQAMWQEGVHPQAPMVVEEGKSFAQVVAISGSGPARAAFCSCGCDDPLDRLGRCLACGWRWKGYSHFELAQLDLDKQKPCKG